MSRPKLTSQYLDSRAQLRFDMSVARWYREGGKYMRPTTFFYLGASVLAASGCASRFTASGNPTGSGSATGSGSGSGTGGGAPLATCGNGLLEPGESCDGTDLNQSSCAALGFDSGTLQCAASCKFDTSGCLGALKPSISPSRTTCTAPCAVFFDATATSGLQNGDYVGANFSWDFDSTNVDPGGAHRSTIGFVSAHVYDKPGTYQVAVRVRDVAGHAGSSVVPITVSAMTGSAIYVSSSKGNDSNAGTIDKPLATLSAGLKHAAPQVSVLLKRGDTFNLGTNGFGFSVSGPFLLGAYTDPASPATNAPVLNSTVPSAGFGGVLDVEKVSDIRLTDLHVVAAAGAFQGAFINTTSHILFERVEIEGVGLPSSTGTLTFQLGAGADATFIVDSNLHDFNGYGVYGDRPTRFAIVGTNISNFSGGDHGVRIQGGDGTGFANLSYVAENTIAPNTSGNASFDASAFRGDDTNIVEVNNDMRRVISFTPQNLTVVEHISNILVEGNLLSSNIVPTDSAYTAVSIRAQNVVVRNNIVIAPGLVVDVEGHPLLPANFVDNINVYNNTVYLQPPSGFTTNATVHFLSHRTTTGNVTLRNNIFWIGTTSATSGYISTDKMGTETEDHNLGYAPNVQGTWTNAPSGTGDVVANPMFISTDGGNAGFLRLAAGSPAIDTGASSTAFQDFSTLVSRPQGAGWDIGAFEFVPSSSASQDGSITSGP